jgi:hypothetical protein
MEKLEINCNYEIASPLKIQKREYKNEVFSSFFFKCIIFQAIVNNIFEMEKRETSVRPVLKSGVFQNIS